MRCDQCRFWEPRIINDDETGECKRNPPFPQSKFWYMYPSTMNDDWCGEFKEKEQT